MPFFDPSLFPIVVGAFFLYWGIPNPNKRLWFVTAVSLSILAWLHPIFALSAIGLSSWAFQTAKRLSERKTSSLIYGAVFIPILFLLVGKYAPFAFKLTAYQPTWVERYLIVPLGISYFVFKLIQYLLDSYRGLIKSHSYMSFLSFLVFFPVLPAGPIETYQHFYRFRKNELSVDLINVGLRRVLLGYFKKLVILELLFTAFFSNFIKAYQASPMPGIEAIQYAAIMFFQAYVDLSAYTDLAIGFSALFGFNIVENFDRPLLSRNIGEFWRRWHISLSQWCRNNVFFPIFGMTRKSWVAAYASMLVMGLWHQLSLNWLAWGAYHGTGLVAWGASQKYLKRMGLSPRQTGYLDPIRIGLTILFVAFGFTLVSVEDFSQGTRIFFACFQTVASYLT